MIRKTLAHFCTQELHTSHIECCEQDTRRSIPSRFKSRVRGSAATLPLLHNIFPFDARSTLSVSPPTGAGCAKLSASSMLPCIGIRSNSLCSFICIHYFGTGNGGHRHREFALLRKYPCRSAHTSNIRYRFLSISSLDTSVKTMYCYRLDVSKLRKTIQKYGSDHRKHAERKL